MNPISLFHISRNQRIKVVIFLALIIVITCLLLSTCKKTPEIISAPVQIVQTVNMSHLNDSIMLASQQVLIAETQEQLHILQTSLSQEIAKKEKMGKVITTISYRDSIIYRDVPGQAVYIETIQRDSIFPLRFKHSNKYLTEYYTVHSKDSASIDSLAIVGKEHLIIGETGKWYQKKRIKIGLVNENPYFVVDSLHSVIYKPKSEIQVAIGPVMMISKNATTLGAGITLKKGIFTFTLAYKVF